MTEHELEQRLRVWYRSDVGANAVAPAGLRASVLEIPSRMPSDHAMQTRSRLLLLAAAAMLVVLLVGGVIAIGSALLRLPAPDSDLRPNLPPNWREQLETDLPAGTYYLDVPLGRAEAGAMRVTFTIPDGWEHVRIDGLLWGQDKWISVAVPDNLYVEGCTAHVLADPPVGPTAGDLAGALRSVAGWTVLRTRDVTLAGYSGKRVEMVAPADGSRCLGDVRLLHVQGGPGYVPAMRDGERVTLWILDVGEERVVIWEGSEVHAPPESLAERQRVVDSIQIQLLRGLPPQMDRGSGPG